MSYNGAITLLTIDQTDKFTASVLLDVMLGNEYTDAIACHALMINPCATVLATLQHRFITLCNERLNTTQKFMYLLRSTKQYINPAWTDKHIASIAKELTETNPDHYGLLFFVEYDMLKNESLPSTINEILLSCSGNHLRPEFYYHVHDLCRTLHPKIHNRSCCMCSLIKYITRRCKFKRIRPPVCPTAEGPLYDQQSYATESDGSSLSTSD